MRRGGSWLVRTGRSRERCMHGGRQLRRGLRASHPRDRELDQGQSPLPTASIRCWGTWRERRGEEPSRDWGRRSSLHGHCQVPGTSCSWDGAFPFPGLFLATSSCGIWLPWLLSASRPCSLHPLLSAFIFLSV